MSERYVVKPVYKALRVLQLLAQTQQGLSLGEISAQLGIPKTTVFRYLHTLRELDFVTYDASADRYRVGSQLWAMSAFARDDQRLREAALPGMLALREQFNETINLAILDNREIVYLEILEAERPLRMQARVGTRDPAYATAVGKAILAFTAPERLPACLPTRWIPFTPRTITTAEALTTELEQTRQRGYAIDEGENEDGSFCIAVPIFDRSAAVIAAMSVAAPASRLSTHGKHKTVAKALQQTAARISTQLGYRASVDG